MNIWDKVRFWVIKCLAGDTAVMLNMQAKNGAVTIEPRRQALVSGCEFNHTAVETYGFDGHKITYGAG